MPLSRAVQAHIEKWLADHAFDIRKYRSLTALKELYFPKPAPRQVSGFAAEALHNDIRAEIGDLPIFYLEFGVFRGRTISRIAKLFPHPDARFFGFDSFEGLPEDWTLAWKTMERGTFTVGGQEPSVEDTRIKFVKGWFQNTVPDFLEAQPDLSSKTVLVHFDADLYSSTLFLLGSLWPKLNSYYFIFDEFLEHEAIALHDFCQAYPVEIEYFCQTNGDGLPNTVSGRMTRIPLVVPARALVQK